MGDVVKILLEPLANLYGPPPNDSKAVVDGYVTVLQGFDDATLAKAYERLLATFEPTRWVRWPSPATCRKACEYVAPDTSPNIGSSAVELSFKRRREESRAWSEGWLKGSEQGRAATEYGFGHEARQLAAQIHYQTAKDGRSVGFAEVAIDAATFDELWRAHGKRIATQKRVRPKVPA